MSRRRGGKSSLLPRNILRALRLEDGRGVLLAYVAGLLTICAVLAVWSWRTVGPRILGSEEYHLSPSEIVISEPPRWVAAADIKRQVIRDASLEQKLSLNDARLAERVALAFAAHPWVQKVERVEKFYPARVEVTIRYREPVAAVKVGSTLVPIDRDAVRLPADDFAPADLRKFPRIASVAARSTPGVGGAWGDARVVGGAVIAAAFGELWHTMDLVEILPGRFPVRGKRNVYVYQLVTRDGRRIDWGPQSADAVSGMETATRKFEMLKQHVERNGTLDGLSLDERMKTEIPRTAVEPSGGSDPRR